ncbi:hypothetical protein GF407_19555 [candidate division KSB1 bacterium]|nr:hypothetical protein [candidate division KSB1 bacterium]
MNRLDYKSNYQSALERLEQFYNHRPQDRIYACFDVPSPARRDFRQTHSPGYCSYPDLSERLEFWDQFLQEKKHLQDDSLPAAYLSEFDQGLYGGLVGGKVQFMCAPETGWISSMVPPILESWQQFGELKIDKTHPWFNRYIHQLDAYVSKGDNKFGISHFILIDGLNFVFELIGATNTYLSLIENPGLVKEAIGFAFELNLLVQNTFFEHVPLLEQGTFSNMGQWIPGKIVSESVDPFHMTSTDYFEAWGREPIERIFARFDGGILHIHGNGRHLLNAVSSIQGLKAILLLNDTGYAQAFEVLDDLKSRCADVPLVVEADYSSFVRQLQNGRLPGGVLYHIRNVPDIETANLLMPKIIDYRADMQT